MSRMGKEDIYYEPDPRHAEIIVNEMGVAGSASVVTPGVKMSSVPEEDDPLLSPAQATKIQKNCCACKCPLTRPN